MAGQSSKDAQEIGGLLMAGTKRTHPDKSQLKRTHPDKSQLKRTHGTKTTSKARKKVAGYAAGGGTMSGTENPAPLAIAGGSKDGGKVKKPRAPSRRKG